jgi:hypothetical protein
MQNGNHSLGNDLASEITIALREIGRIAIEVRLPKSHVVLSDRDFWASCGLLTPNPEKDLRSRIFVDGFNGCCHWNSWKVVTNAIEPGLSLWAGFAFARGAWVHHEWCMLEGRIVETTHSYALYYGGKVYDREFEIINQRFAGVDLTKYVNPKGVCTFVNERRQVVPYDRSVYGATIGREETLRLPLSRKGLDGNVIELILRRAFLVVHIRS